MKNYYHILLASLMISATPLAKAEVSSMNDLFGKYKFTATMTVTDAGKSYQNDFSDNCEVTIEESSSSRYQAQIIGLAGASGPETSMKVSGFDASTCTFSVPSPGGINNLTFADNLLVGNIQGAYPYANGNSPTLTFTYDPSTKAMTITDFTIVGNVNHGAQTCEIFATFTDAKLTLIEAASTELPDISGVWNIVAGTDTYDTYPNSTLPTSYVLTLTQTSKGVYTAQFDIEGLPSFTLDGTFDGDKLTIPFDNKVIDADKNIALTDFGTQTNTGSISFTYKDGTLSDSNPLYITSNGAPLQWWSNITIPQDTFAWDGTYTVTSANLFPLDGGTWDNPFEMTITQQDGKYYVTSFLGNNVYTINSGSMGVTIASDNKSATICINGGNSGYKSAFLKMDETYNFYLFCDGNNQRETLTMTRNDDDTITLSDFGFLYGSFDASSVSAVAYYFNNTMVKGTSGISSINADNKADIQVVANSIVLDNAQPVIVYDLSGRVVYQGITNTVNDLSNGIYIVKANDTVAKVSIR